MFDYFKFMATAFPTEKPVWTTDNEIVFEHPAFLLRCFRKGPGKPTLVVPPQAGHSSHIADFDTGKSLIETVLKTRTGPVYCIEWLSATQARKRESIESLVLQLDAALNIIGPSHLIGLCQGGWLSFIYTILFHERTLSWQGVNCPIDFHAGGGAIYDSITTHGMAPYRAIVDANDGIMPGAMMLLGWKMMHPMERFMGDYMDIFTDVLLWKGKELSKTKRFRIWFENVKPIAGVWYLQACEWFFLKNQLVRGELILFGKPVDPSKITCKIAMVASADDDITNPLQLFAAGDIVSSKEQLKITIPDTGHIGGFMGRKSQKYLADAIAWIDGKERHSTPEINHGHDLYVDGVAPDHIMELL